MVHLKAGKEEKSERECESSLFSCPVMTQRGGRVGSDTLNPPKGFAGL